MKRYLFFLWLLGAMLFGDVHHRLPDRDLVTSDVPIVDIRTPGEWRETGLLKGSIPIMFFDERNRYDLNGFLKALNDRVDTSKPFALICNSGTRTRMVSGFLSKQYGYDVINLKGGIQYAIANRLPIEPYKE